MPDIVDGSGLWSSTSSAAAINSGLDIIDGTMLWSSTSAAQVTPPAGGAGAVLRRVRKPRRWLVDDEEVLIIN